LSKGDQTAARIVLCKRIPPRLAGAAGCGRGGRERSGECEQNGTHEKLRGADLEYYLLLFSVVAITVGMALVGVGIKGFSTVGLPITSGLHLTGIPGKLCGILCVSSGITIIVYFVFICQQILQKA
jgi:hypothetical protein